MKRWRFLLALLAACGGRGPVVTFSTEAAPIVLPIEVLGAAGAEREVALALDARVVAAARKLRLRVHRLDRPDKARLQVNQAAWLPLDNDTVELQEPAHSFGGIGGGFATLTMDVPLPGTILREGVNTLRFAFSPHASTFSIGYRVLSFDLIDEAGKGLLGRRFAEEEPRKWKPLHASPAAIARGEDLWARAPLPALGATALHCGDCHTRDGRDLAYFAYSDVSIIESAKRFGLTDEEGRFIASYIRSQPVTPWGRPWNPPYQPGPELDLRPLEAWAAGVGAEGTAVGDVQTLPLLFRTGIDAAAVATSSQLNIRELPIVLQLPDWNHWLPPVHPAQFWGERFTKHPAFERYEMIRQRLAAGGKDYARGALPADLESWAGAWSSDFTNEVTRGLQEWPPELAAALYSGARWRMVKAWELMQEFDLEGVGGVLYASMPEGESRTWLSRINFASSTSPNRNRTFDTSHPRALLLHRYYESAWRHLGLILNPGNRRRFSFTPFPYRDAISDVHLLYEESGVPELTRLLAIIVKGLQEMDNGMGPERQLQGWSLSDVVRISSLVSSQFEPIWSSVTAPQRRQITEAIVRAWWTTHARFPLTSWPRGEGPDALPAADYRPTVDRPASSAVDELFLALPRFREIGVDPALVDEIRGWCAQMWPLGQW